MLISFDIVPLLEPSITKYLPLSIEKVPDELVLVNATETALSGLIVTLLMADIPPMFPKTTGYVSALATYELLSSRITGPQTV
jgi:hypothetical protein